MKLHVVSDKDKEFSELVELVEFELAGFAAGIQTKLQPITRVALLLRLQ